MFRKYAEKIDWSPEDREAFDVEKSSSESLKLLSKIAVEHKIWLIGGTFKSSLTYRRKARLIRAVLIARFNS
jgi:hypothetical protein